MIQKFKSSSLLLCGVVLLCDLLLVRGQLPSGISVVLGQKHYYIETINQANFFQASNMCKQLGMSLASIEKDVEKKNLKSFLTVNGISENIFWLSGTKYGTDADSYWLGTGKRFTTSAQGTEKCLSTTANDFDYSYAVACNTAKPYICEKPLQPTCGKYGQCRYHYIENSN